MLSKFVKISKVSSLSDARYCAGMMVDLMGFNVVAGSRDFVSPGDFKEITDWVAGVDFVVECEDLEHEDVEKVIEDYPLQFLESKRVEVIESLANSDLKLIFKTELKSSDDISELMETINSIGQMVEYFVVEAADESLYQDFENLFTDIEMKILKGSFILPSTISTLPSLYRGIQLEGSPEDQPGFKDYGDVMDVLEALEVE